MLTSLPLFLKNKNVFSLQKKERRNKQKIIEIPRLKIQTIPIFLRSIKHKKRFYHASENKEDKNH